MRWLLAGACALLLGVAGGLEPRREAPADASAAIPTLLSPSVGGGSLGFIDSAPPLPLVAGLGGDLGFPVEIAGSATSPSTSCPEVRLQGHPPFPSCSGGVPLCGVGCSGNNLPCEFVFESILEEETPYWEACCALPGSDVPVVKRTITRSCAQCNDKCSLGLCNKRSDGETGPPIPWKTTCLWWYDCCECTNPDCPACVNCIAPDPFTKPGEPNPFQCSHSTTLPLECKLCNLCCLP